MTRFYSGNSISLTQSLAVTEGKRRESSASIASSRGLKTLALTNGEEPEIEDAGAGSPLAEDDEDKLMALPFQDVSQEGPMLPWEPVRMPLNDQFPQHRLHRSDS
eukprot:symbB.v1.2.039765.t1/scaffold6770.1/size15648/3